MNQVGNAEANQARPRLEQEWQSLIEQTAPRVITLLGDILQRDEPELRQRYLAYLAADNEIRTVIGDDVNRDDYTEMFISGVRQLLQPADASGKVFYARQEEIGLLMARIGLPPYAVSRAMRRLTLWLLRHLAERDISRAMLIDSTAYIISAIGLALEVREISYQTGVTSHARIEEAYRLYALGQNLAMERERQRALLMEWGHKLLTAFHRRAGHRKGNLPSLWSSEFGLWLNHKARILFDKAPRLDVIPQAVDRIDKELLPALEAVDYGDHETVDMLLRDVEDQLGAIKFALIGIFDLHLEIEKGRDPLTQLLNRRFMPSVLMREIYLQKTSRDHGFAVLLIDIDHFKRINDSHGHKAGDLALQQASGVITSGLRPSDFIFRYGGEEIMVVLVDCNAQMAMQTAERIRADIAALHVTTPDQVGLSFTVSIGVAPFAGEFDYEALLSRADAAMYQAKAAGRNRVVAA